MALIAAASANIRVGSVPETVLKGLMFTNHFQAGRLPEPLPIIWIT